MRAVVQRVSEASVTIGGVVKGEIQTGLVVLVGIEEADTAEDIEWLSGKLTRLRIFNDEASVMNRSVQEVAVPLYQDFIARLPADLGQLIQTGEFGADMKVKLVNDGPVTITIDTR